MSTYTNNLNLFKYDVINDAKQAFSITNALNNNWDIIDDQIFSILNNCSQTNQDIVTLSNGTIPLTETKSLYYIEIASNTTFTFDVTNIPYDASKAFTFELAIYMSTAYQLTFPSGTTWQDGNTPNVTDAGTYFFAFRRLKSQNWKGSLQGVWQ